MVGARGFEPPASWTQTRHATRLRHAPTSFDCDTRIFKKRQGENSKDSKPKAHIKFKKFSLFPFLSPLKEK